MGGRNDFSSGTTAFGNITLPRARLIHFMGHLSMLQRA